MASELAERFMRSLQEIERSREVGPLVDLFADDAELTNLAHAEPRRGRDGAARFWEEYLHAFRSVRSEFRPVVENENGILLEWTSEGELQGGAPIAYRGVSVLEAEGGKVKRFRTYYDSAAFLSPAARENEMARAGA